MIRINPIFSEAATGSLDGNFWGKARDLNYFIIADPWLVDLKDKFSRQPMSKFTHLPLVKLPLWARSIIDGKTKED